MLSLMLKNKVKGEILSVTNGATMLLMLKQMSLKVKYLLLVLLLLLET